MSELLPTRRRLLIVSDTSMFRKTGQIFALGPVVREINALLPLFDHITWIGFNQPKYVEDPSFTVVDTSKTRLILLPKCGGDRFGDKVIVLLRTPWMLLQIWLEMLHHEVVYTRAPSAPAFIATLLSFFFSKKIFWHKYAGNWIQHPAPRFFAVQRSLLKKASNSKVTINGQWPDQAAHCLSFENPCLDQSEFEQGEVVSNQKDFEGSLEFCFVGRLEAAKGVQWILEALKTLPSNTNIAALHLVGDGPMRQECEALAATSKIPIHVYGFLGQDAVHKIMIRSHILLLPSAAEGFPKVVAEAANLGCIPMVSDVSCISQYIRHGENGFLLDPILLPQGQLSALISNLPEPATLKKMATRAHSICSFFTYEHFVERVKREILRPN